MTEEELNAIIYGDKIKATEEQIKKYQTDENGYIIKNKDGSPRKKKGRPEKDENQKTDSYCKIDWDIVMRCLGKGLSVRQTASLIGVSESTLYYHKERLEEAKNLGNALMAQFVIDLTIEEIERTRNPQLIKLALMKYAGWSDKPVEVEEATNFLNELSDEELIKLEAELN